MVPSSRGGGGNQMIAGAGQLDQRLTLQVPAAGLDAHGGETGAWVDIGTVWGRAEPLRGRDFFAAAQTQASVSVRFTVRYSAALTAARRVVWLGRPYDLQGQPIDVQGRRVYLELMCDSGVRDGR